MLRLTPNKVKKNMEANEKVKMNRKVKVGKITLV